MMPGMDGFEVARRLKAGPDTVAIPIVFMTALTETEHVVAAFAAGGPFAPVPLIDWVRREAAGRRSGAAATPPQPWLVGRGGRRLALELHAMAGIEDGLAAAGDDGSDDEWLIVASETNDAALIDAMVLTFRLTAREAEVLVWVARGKTNRGVGDILGARPRTITKHMEHILPKLGVETRTAAAGLVLTHIPGFSQSRG